MNHILTQILFENDVVDEKIYSFQALLEDRIDFIKKQHNNKYDPLIDHIANNMDPTKNKKYTQWVLNRMITGDNIPQPDVLKSSLELFDKASPKSHEHDINKHTMSSMMDVAHLSKTSPKNVKSAENDIDKIYDKDGVTAFKVNDKNTMINLYGPGRKHSSTWCTAAAGHDNMFDRYDGNKYTVHYPNGHFMSFHHGTLQAKDPNNTEIDFSSDNRYKQYNDHTNEIMRMTANNDKEYDELPNTHFGLSQKNFDSAWDHFSNVNKWDEKGRKFTSFVGKNKLSDEQFNAAIKHGHVQKVLANPYLSDRQVSHLVDNHDWLDSRLPANPAVRGENVDKIVNKLHSLPTYSYKIGSMKNLENHHVDDIIDKTEPGNRYHDILYDLSSNDHKFTAGQINKIAPKSNIHLMTKIASKQTVPAEHLKNIIHNDDFVRQSVNLTHVLDNNTVPDNDIHRMIDKFNGNDNKIVQILNAKHINRNHVDHIVHLYSNKPKLSGDFDPTISEDIISHNKLNADDVDKLLFKNPNKGENGIYHDELSAYIGRKDSDMEKIDRVRKINGFSGSELEKAGYYKKKNLPESHFSDPEHAMHIAKNLKYHPNITHEHIGKLINAMHEADYTPSSNIIKSIMDHPNVSPDNIKQLARHFVNSNNMVAYVMKSHPRITPSVKQTLKV